MCECFCASIHALTVRLSAISFFFFFNDTATTEIYTLSLHDALPIYTEHSDAPMRKQPYWASCIFIVSVVATTTMLPSNRSDRKSTRLNSSHVRISYAVFCLKKKKLRFDHLFSAYANASQT